MQNLDLPVEAPILERRAGDDFAASYRLLLGGEPLDFADWSLACQWRGNGEVVTLHVESPAPGELLLTGTGVDSRGMLGEGELDIEGIRDGKTQTFVWAPTRFANDVTRRPL